MEHACESAEAIANPAARLPALVEPLEPRVHLTATFKAFISGVADSGTTVTIYLWTTGAAASKWVIAWDSNPAHNQTINAPPGGFSVPYQVSHTYTAQTYSIVATATSATDGTTAIATYALNSGFGYPNGDGTQPNDDQGDTIYTPTGAMGDAGGAGMVVDHGGTSLDGDIYVLSKYNGKAAVTRFTPQGAVDRSFGDTSTPGTWVLSGMGTGTPYGMAISDDGRYVAVCGSFGGWGVALIDAHANTNQGTIAFDKSGVVSTGQAFGVCIDDTDTYDVYAVGNTVASGTGYCCMAAIELDTSGNVPSTWNGGHGVCAFSTGSLNACITATSIVDVDEGQGTGDGDDYLALAGYTTYSGGCDFTLAELTDSGVLETGGTGSDHNFGSGAGYVRTNFGNTIGTGHGAVHIPSTDHAYALAVGLVSGLPYLFAAGGTTALGSESVALGMWSGTDGSLASFGPYGSDGLSVGQAGDAYSVVVKSTGQIVTGGTYNHDMLVSQFDSSGNLDTTFGSGGNFLIDLGGTSNYSTDSGYGVGLASDGSILIGGSTTPSGGSAKIALVDVLASTSIVVS